MHEMGIANSVLDAVQLEASRFPNARICKVGLRIGAMAGVDPDSLGFCFEALVRETEFESLTLEIEYLPHKLRCTSCGCLFVGPVEGFACPACGSEDSQLVGGDELEFAYLEVDDGTDTARTEGAQRE
jgi:hydrogenase nickel incorporation protein HypA/HybF